MLRSRTTRLSLLLLVMIGLAVVIPAHAWLHAAAEGHAPTHASPTEPEGHDREHHDHLHDASHGTSHGASHGTSHEDEHDSTSWSICLFGGSLSLTGVGAPALASHELLAVHDWPEPIRLATLEFVHTFYGRGPPVLA